MRSPLRTVMKPVLFAALALGIHSEVARADAPATVQVRVRESKLRSQPKFWASGVADLHYGDSLTVVGSDASWFKVKTKSGAVGYVHPTSVTDNKIVLSKSGSVSNTVDKSEVALAGKGFSKEVEKEYAATNPKLNFKAVDSMERIKVSNGELLSFLHEGKLGSGKL